MKFHVPSAFPGVGVVPSPCIWVSFKPPLCPNTAFVIVHAKPVPAANPSTTFKAWYSESTITEYISQSLCTFPLF